MDDHGSRRSPKLVIASRREMGGFAVHFLDHALVDRPAKGRVMLDVVDSAEGKLPRRFVAVTMCNHPPAADGSVTGPR